MWVLGCTMWRCTTFLHVARRLELAKPCKEEKGRANQEGTHQTSVGRSVMTGSDAVIFGAIVVMCCYFGISRKMTRNRMASVAVVLHNK
ncbi:hypothetical protein BCR39DRAFT_168046 [Naematelia encephala]|uniref:Uncharacterized protein n=1 Tax=Naematelia encephala TaxID=71784 RepID=A0A1Y2B4N7_9TREE|nr:hypothetical protein BCR39DRAFT_168046 [Naematelia encephala]